MAAGTFDLVRRQVEQHIATHWSLTTVSWPNVVFNPPEDGIWIQVTMLPGQAGQITMGTAGENRIYGVVHINLFVPLNRGMGEAWNKVDSLRSLFNRVTIGPVRFRVPSAGVPTLSQSWWQIPVSCPFSVDETV
jgi:hypothetical protein